ncbi:MAG: zinc transporter ZupT [Bacillota bacterium]
MGNVYIAFGMTLIAGLCTGLGSFIALLSKKENKVFLSVSLGFSAGVMIYVSFVEIFQKAKDSLVLELGEKNGQIATVLAFFGGMLVIAVIDRLIPKEKNPHELASFEPSNTTDIINEKSTGTLELASESAVPTEKNQKSLMRMGLFTALAIAIHNFPEGLATFISALGEMEVAIPIVVAIAMHNVPEGIAVSVPIYHATGSKKKAFIYSFLSGLSEPIGALVGWWLLMPIMTDTVFGVIFASVAGIMVFISIDELLPCAREYGKNHHAIVGFMFGMAVMAVSLLLFV